MLLIILVVISALFLTPFLFMRQEKFGKLPKAERKKRILNSPNYKDGKFQNLSFTPDLAEGVTYTQILKEFFFNRSKRSKPLGILPGIKTNLLQLNINEQVLVWMGHSSYFIQVDGKRILVDPVLSGSASPISITTKSFRGSDRYGAADIPEIDILFLSHDHWDHLDHKTILALKPKIKKIITGLGTAQHLEHWGINSSIIHELDWYDVLPLADQFKVIAQPARHFSGRGFKRNQALWLSFVLETPTQKIFLGGDSGFDTHFKSIGESHGPFDLAILECGQYNAHWRYIHMMPEELIEAALALKAKKILPVHWAKFSLALHAWDDPIKRFSASADKNNIAYLHPMIGELVDLNSSDQQFTKWWNQLV